MSADAPDTAGTEIPQAATSEARAVAPALISSIEAVARSRLLTVGVDALLAEVAALLEQTMYRLRSSSKSGVAR